MAQSPNELTLREGKPRDIPIVQSFEGLPENQGVVGAWSKEGHLRAMHHADYGYLIVEVDGKPAGFIIIKGVEAKDIICVVRIIIGETGRGRGSKALRALKALCFERWGAHRFWLEAIGGNTRAQRFYEREGLKHEGVFRKHYHLGGEWVDSIIYGMLPEDYEASKKSEQAQVSQAL